MILIKTPVKTQDKPQSDPKNPNLYLLGFEKFPEQNLGLAWSEPLALQRSRQVWDENAHYQSRIGGMVLVRIEETQNNIAEDREGKRDNEGFPIHERR